MKLLGNFCMIKNEYNILIYLKFFFGNRVLKYFDILYCFKFYLWLKEFFRFCINIC